MKAHTCVECGGWGGHHFTGCPEMPDLEDDEDSTDHDCGSCNTQVTSLPSLTICAGLGA